MVNGEWKKPLFISSPFTIHDLRHWVVKYSCHFGHLDNSHFMGRFVSYIGISLLMLLVSNWESVIAATLCPHAGMSRSVEMAEDHSCCRAKLEKAEEHHKGAHQEAAHNAKAKPSSAIHLHDNDNNNIALGQTAGECVHCMGQREFPAAPASVRELTLQKRYAGKIVKQTIILPAPPTAVAVAHLTPTQHAPPGLSGRKHLLLSVFLI
jgi:hypothetical protein